MGNNPVGKLTSELVKVGTLGIVNVGSYGINIKDPVTGIVDIGKDIKSIGESYYSGVWFGERGVGLEENPSTAYKLKDVQFKLGIQTFVTRTLNLNLCHSAVMVDGQLYHITDERGSSSIDGNTFQQMFSHDKSKVRAYKVTHPQLIKQALKEYKWYFKGKAARNSSELTVAIDRFNVYWNGFNLFTNNCQTFAYYFAKYALGDIDFDELCRCL